MIRITVWNEYIHEKQEQVVHDIYPEGIHAALAEALKPEPDFTVRVATLDMPECGLSQQVLDETDVLLWWGHMAHEDVPDEIVTRVQQRVLDGMGIICLHSAHASKIFHRLMGTRTLSLRWREDSELCRLWVIEPSHPIAAGLSDYIDILCDETYGEHFEIPTPEELVFVSWFPGGEVFRSGCCWRRGLGRVFYFQPGHETFPIYHQPEIRQILRNAVRWAAPTYTFTPFSGHSTRIEPR